MEKLRTLDLFSGIGGFSLGLDSTGYFETVAFCEIEEFPCKVLNKHWPEVPIYNDVRELSYEKLQADGLISRRRGIDVICGGYPCQPFSVAGRQKGEEDPRHLWPEYFRLVRELRPSYVIGENVGGHIRLGLDSVLEDLDSENYTVRCFSVEAASLGAPHRRERIFWIADRNPNGNNVDQKRKIQERASAKSYGTCDDVSDTQSERRGGRNRGGRRAEQWELLKTEQEGRTLGREAERCSELPGQEGEGSAPDVADASSNGRDAKRTDQETRGTLGGSIEGRMLESEGSGSRSEVSGTEHVADAECESEHGVSNGGSDVKPKKKRQKTGSIDGSNCGTDVTDTHSEGLEGTEEARNSEEERTIAEQFTARQGAKRSEEERGETAFESYLGGGNDGISAWLDGSWERGIPRVAPSNKLRVPRLKALGNAVLPQLVYMVGMTIVLSTKRSKNEEE
jgi:DNA (cytosine-5)-methyltransferase 1